MFYRNVQCKHFIGVIGLILHPDVLIQDESHQRARSSKSAVKLMLKSSAYCFCFNGQEEEEDSAIYEPLPSRRPCAKALEAIVCSSFHQAAEL